MKKNKSNFGDTSDRKPIVTPITNARLEAAWCLTEFKREQRGRDESLLFQIVIHVSSFQVDKMRVGVIKWVKYKQRPAIIFFSPISGKGAYIQCVVEAFTLGGHNERGRERWDSSEHKLLSVTPRGSELFACEWWNEPAEESLRDFKRINSLTRP